MSLFEALDSQDHSRVDSILAEAQAAGVLQQLLTSQHIRGGTGWPPLHVAVIVGDSQLVTTLLAAGAPVDAEAFGGTALVEAAGLGHSDIVKVLLRCGAAATATAKYEAREWSMLECACSSFSRCSPDAVKELIAAGAASQLTGEALTYTLCEVVCYGVPDILEKFLQVVQLPASTANAGVLTAVEEGRWDMLQLLLHAGAAEGDAVLEAIRQAANGSVKALGVLQDLLAAGAPVDAALDAARGLTALQFAAFLGSVEAVRVLLAAGAATDVRCSFHRTALHYACQKVDITGNKDSRCSSELVGILLAAGAPAGLALYREDQQLRVLHSPLDEAAIAGNASVLHQLCSQLSAEGPGAAGELPAIYWVAMCFAAQRGHVGAMQELFASCSHALYHTPAAGHLGPLRPAAEIVVHIAADTANPAVMECIVLHCSPQLLIATVLVDAAAAIPAAGLLPPGGPVDWSCPEGTSAEMEREAVLLLLRAAVERSDPQSIFAALQPAVDPSNAQPAAAEFGSLEEATAYCKPQLLNQFAQLMSSTYSQLEHQRSTAQWAVHCMCVDVVLQCMAESGSQGDSAYAARGGEVDAAAVMPTCDKTATLVRNLAK